MAEALAIDPGGTTGMACVYYTYDDGPVTWTSWEIGDGEHHARLAAQIDEIDPETIICERFDYRSHMDHAELISREYIGVTKLIRPDVVLQSSSEAMGFGTDDRLRALDLWVPGSEHRRDAYRHLLYWLVIREGIKKGIVDRWLRKAK